MSILEIKSPKTLVDEYVLSLRNHYVKKITETLSLQLKESRKLGGELLICVADDYDKLAFRQVCKDFEKSGWIITVKSISQNEICKQITLEPEKPVAILSDQ